ncbi:hypothetical protein [Oceanicola sp. S124]|uniref:hypothetical protein n=1 Tax=Oceanicola sp. S124 TaxID=1042378 RepID=UPI0002557E4A|nr:hypothetical protein [Oceanicola sp. S124]
MSKRNAPALLALSLAAACLQGSGPGWAEAAPAVSVQVLPDAAAPAGSSAAADPQGLAPAASLRPKRRPEGPLADTGAAGRPAPDGPATLAPAGDLAAAPASTMPGTPRQSDPEAEMLARTVLGMLSTTTDGRSMDGAGAGAGQGDAGAGIGADLAAALAMSPPAGPDAAGPDAAGLESRGSGDLDRFLPGAASVAPPAALRPRARPEGFAVPVAWYDKPGQPCEAASGFPDPDIGRNAATFEADPDLCISRDGFSEHGRNWQLTVVRNLSTRRGPVWAVLHDNENAAFDAALYAVHKYGGALIAVEAGENRVFMGQDPNRNFSLTASSAATCRDISQKPTPGFTNAIAGYFSQRYPVLTLHNNDDGYSGAGGAGTISARRSSASMTGMMTPTPQGALSDEDNAILLAGSQPFEANRQARQATGAFHAAGVNVIYEHVRPERNDCSFSFFTTMNGLGDYYNIEAQHGALEAQRQMVDVLMRHLAIASLW